jgi:hypothetical protein
MVAGCRGGFVALQPIEENTSLKRAFRVEAYKRQGVLSCS